jgi:hypothetical protein
MGLEMMYAQSVSCSFVTCILVHDPYALLADTFLFLKGAICLARSFKIINESLTSLDLGFNEIRVSKHSVCFFILLVITILGVQYT